MLQVGRTALSEAVITSSRSASIVPLLRPFHSTAVMPSVTVINSYDEFKKAINGDKPAIIDFHAEWCGPCKVISPKFNAFSDEYSEINFYSVDVDAQPDVAQECGIQAMPTFQLFKSSEKIDSMKGAVPAKLEEMVKKHSGR